MATGGVRTTLIQPLSNRDQEHQKYYTLIHLAQGDHPPPYSTMCYGQVRKKQKKQWTQIPDDRETVGWSATPTLKISTGWNLVFIMNR
jgi:hypothetical protein